MRHIYKIFHEKSVSEFDKVYQQRFHYESTIHLGLSIKPMNQPNTYPLYYVPTNNMLQMINKIHLISNNLQRTYNVLPKVAQNQFLNECIVEELFNTNDLEGIRSTREEIARSTKEIKLSKKSKNRFESMIKLYMKMIQNELEFPAAPTDIRKIYDDITNGEIEPDELPDGDIFRKDITYILKKSGTGKMVHQGITPESGIVTAVEQLLKFMNEKNGIPVLIKVAIGHYYFGYIHPFYDGNGRTSRYISSMYLSQTLGNVPALSLSRGCNQSKNKYLEAFEVTNSIKSRGELNCFIETFLEIIIEAMGQMNAELKEKIQLLELAIKKIENESGLTDEEDRNIMFVLAQHQFFDSGNGLSIKDLAEIQGKSEATIRKKMRELSSLTLIEQKGERPAYYCIRQQFLEI